MIEWNGFDDFKESAILVFDYWNKSQHAERKKRSEQRQLKIKRLEITNVGSWRGRLIEWAETGEGLEERRQQDWAPYPLPIAIVLFSYTCFKLDSIIFKIFQSYIHIHLIVCELKPNK